MNLIFIKPYEKKSNLVFHFRRFLSKIQKRLNNFCFFYETNHNIDLILFQNLNNQINEMILVLIKNANVDDKIKEILNFYDKFILTNDSLFIKADKVLINLWDEIINEKDFPEKPFLGLENYNVSKMNNMLHCFKEYDSLEGITKKIKLDLSSLFQIPEDYDEDKEDWSLESIVPLEVRDYYDSLMSVCNLHVLINQLRNEKKEFEKKVEMYNKEEENERQKYMIRNNAQIKSPIKECVATGDLKEFEKLKHNLEIEKEKNKKLQKQIDIITKENQLLKAQNSQFLNQQTSNVRNDITIQNSNNQEQNEEIRYLKEQLEKQNKLNQELEKKRLKIEKKFIEFSEYIEKEYNNIKQIIDLKREIGEKEKLIKQYQEKIEIVTQNIPSDQSKIQLFLAQLLETQHMIDKLKKGKADAKKMYLKRINELQIILQEKGISIP